MATTDYQQISTQHIAHIADRLKLQARAVGQVQNLLADGATIPFIARYRKEATQSMDEQQIEQVRDALNAFEELEKRREYILKTIEGQEKLTSGLEEKIRATWDKQDLEDLFLPYKPKRHTRGEKAKAAGLEPLANKLLLQADFDFEAEAAGLVSENFTDTDAVLQGARDIIAEQVGEDAKARARLRGIARRTALFTAEVVKTKKEEAIKYQTYFAYSRPVDKTPAHAILACMRGADEGFLRVKTRMDDEAALDMLQRMFVQRDNPASGQVRRAVEDSYKRLLFPAIERELFSAAKARADEASVRVFAKNLRQLLMAPPLGGRRVLAIDPGYQSGCKVVCLDAHGDLVHNENIYPHPPQKEIKKASRKIAALVDAHEIEVIAVGNGTAGRATENFLRKSIRLPREVDVYMVNEDGASVYSASAVARGEMPQYDVTVRGAVSIGRRLMDPLAELVKIDPKAIGVGQYQHDVDQKMLKDKLTQEVEYVVNEVGVDVNTASKHLLMYVSGITPKVAENILASRSENGNFTSRKALLKVPKLGPKTYEQAAGFLRIVGAKNPLDNSAVHPEAYHIVDTITKKYGTSINEIVGNEAFLKSLKPEEFTTDTFGLPTVRDILKELRKPSRDPRQQVARFNFSEHINTIEDLQAGMQLPGIVNNVTNFGAFVDLGIKENGLIHISELANRFISDPSEVVALNQQVVVKILEVDTERKRIQLSLKQVDMEIKPASGN